MGSREVEVERVGGVAVVALNRPRQGNALTPEMARDLREACRALAGEEGLRAVVLTGRGGAFCAGPVVPDLEGETSPALVEARLRSLRVADAVAALPVPVVAALDGPALGQGLELALACDIRLAGEGTRLALPHLRHGLLPWDGGVQRLLRIAGPAAAADLLLTGREVEAHEALAIGLVNRVVPGPALPPALELAQAIASLAPIAVRYAKEAVWKGLALPLEEGLRLEADLSVLLHTTRDREEGLRAFREKRRPAYRGE